jgi:DNA (cytosine-5)-methyltransferase 1
MSRANTKKQTRISAVDLFCGVGGLTHGLSKGGIRVTAGIDLDESCRYPFESNNDAIFLARDVERLSSKEVSELFRPGDIRLLAGCAPCQPFSTYSRSGRGKRHDSQWPLVQAFGRLVRETLPELVTMENVPQLLDHEVFESFLSSLDGYSKWWGLVDCSSIGIPQTRKRLVLLASRLGDCQLSLKQKNVGITTVRQAIGDLPVLSAGEQSAIDRMHIAASLSSLNFSRIKASRAGGTWRDWPIELQAQCHQRSSGATYPSVYGRMEWDKPAPTITTQCFGFGNGRFGHPEQDRAISLREAAILQTFPPNYKFVPDGSLVRFNRLGRMIGNAVPVRLGEVIATTFVEHVEAYSAIALALPPALHHARSSRQSIALRRP